MDNRKPLRRKPPPPMDEPVRPPGQQPPAAPQGQAQAPPRAATRHFSHGQLGHGAAAQSLPSALGHTHAKPPGAAAAAGHAVLSNFAHAYKIPCDSPVTPTNPFSDEAARQLPRHTPQLHINADGAGAEDCSDADITDMLLSFDSPRPKGPQQLLFDDFVSSEVYPDNGPYRVAAGAPYSPPLPPKLPSVPPRPGADSFRSPPRVPGAASPQNTQQLHQQQQPHQSQQHPQHPSHPQHPHPQAVSPLVSRLKSAERKQFPGFPKALDSEDDSPNVSFSNPPYPVEELTFSEGEDPATLFHTPKKSTPVRIPTLVNKQSMRNIGSLTLGASGSPGTSPPPFEKSFEKASPDSLSPQFPHSPFSSPSKSSFLRRSPNTYYDYVSESRTSRSPSPKKAHGSPTARPPYPEDDFYNIYDEYSGEERAPRWSLIERYDTEYFDDSFGLPQPSNEFDYSILPEIPKALAETAPDTTRVLADLESPTIRPTLTIKRKNEELPPVPLDLPSLPFSSSALSGQHFLECSNVWQLSEIHRWCLRLNSWVHDAPITQKDLRKVLMKLVTFHKSDAPLDIIGRNVTQILNSLTCSGALTKENDEKNTIVRIDPKAAVSGVLVDLVGCYCKDSDHKIPESAKRKCYSPHCQINKALDQESLMKSTSVHDLVLGSDWASHWKLSAQDMTIDLSESKRQSLLFDLIKFEQTFIQRGECFARIAFPEFIRSAKLVDSSLGVLQIKDLENKISASAKELVSIHRSSLLEPLLKILLEDGKFIKNLREIASLYYNWSKSALNALLAYMGSMPNVEDLLRNPLLKSWDETLRSNQRMKELQVNGNLLLMSTFNSRYQQLPLQLMDIRKFFDEDDDEYAALTKAITSIQRLGSKVNEMKVHSDNKHSLELVEKQLSWKSHIFQPNLGLLSERRKLLFRGDLFRKGELKINSSTVHLILLDNYLLITDKQRSQRTSMFKVVETPIPIDYLIVEHRDKETPSLAPKSATQTSLIAAEAGDDATSFPFKVRFAGRGKNNSHTFMASSERDRKKWISSLLHAKSNVTRRMSSSQPYKLQLVDNSYFGYEPGFKSRKLPLLPSNDSLMKMAVAKTNAQTAIQQQVHCSESSKVSDTVFDFVGTSAGVYCSDRKNIWKKVINMANVTKLSVIPELNTILVLGSKTLRYYPLQSVIDIYYDKKEKLSSFQLSNEAILFYEYGRHRGVPTVFVAKKKNAGSTTFKVFVMEQDNHGILSTFSMTTRFYIQAECYGLSIFNSSIAVHTQRGFEILDLQKLSPRTVPELPSSDAASKKYDSYSRKKGSHHVDLIKKAISHTAPMGMFKLSNNKEFLLVYSECAIFVNKTGKLSRTTLMRFDFCPRRVSFVDDNLFLVCEEVIEVWAISSTSSSHNKLVQVIPSKDLYMLNDAFLGFKSANPTNPDLQLLFQLVKS